MKIKKSFNKITTISLNLIIGIRSAYITSRAIPIKNSGNNVSFGNKAEKKLKKWWLKVFAYK